MFNYLISRYARLEDPADRSKTVQDQHAAVIAVSRWGRDKIFAMENVPLAITIEDAGDSWEDCDLRHIRTQP